MNTEPSEREEAPERIWLTLIDAQIQADKVSSTDVEYVRADLLTTVRQEAHVAAEMRVLAKAIQQGVNAGKAAVIAAAANSVGNSEGEGVEDE